MDLRTFSRMVLVGVIALAWGGIAFGGDGATVQDPVDAAPNPGPGAHERIEEIQRRIQSALVYPELARRHGVTGVVRLRFEVGGQGRARNIELARSSGSGTLDRAARQAVVEAADLPWVYVRLEVPVRFTLDEKS